MQQDSKTQNVCVCVCNTVFTVTSLGSPHTLATRAQGTKMPSTKYTSLPETEHKKGEQDDTRYIILRNLKLFQQEPIWFLKRAI
jgi:hypothetical protein